MKRAISLLSLTLLTGVASQVAAQPVMTMGTVTCRFGGVTIPTKSNSSTVTFTQTVLCDGQVDSVDLSADVFVIPQGGSTFEFFTGETNLGPPVMISTAPYLSENRVTAARSPCRNGRYIGRSFATVRLGDLTAGGMMVSPSVEIGSCPDTSPPATPGSPPPPTVPPDLPPLPPPTSPLPAPSVDDVIRRVIYKPLADAVAILAGSGFARGATTRTLDSNQKPDTVVAASPNPANPKFIDLTLSSGLRSYSQERPAGCGRPTLDTPTCISRIGTQCAESGMTLRCRDVSPDCQRGTVLLIDLICRP